ncbi:MAG: DinB family protein [Micromonosporaceae bacterium]|nr:DinB family protein [Micromonosporaceae bacterium]
MDWNAQLVDQLEWHWRNALRPRLAGMTDAEYVWEPVKGCWSVRTASETSIGRGTGRFVIEYDIPEPSPPPVTTIAWRMGHIIVGVFGARSASHFGGPPCDYQSFAYAGTAAEALRQLDEEHARWIEGVRGLGADGLARPCGPAEGPFADAPLAALVLHIHREAIHHGAEICLLRDLYRDRG